MTKFRALLLIVITAALQFKCGSDANLVYIYESSENQTIGYFSPVNVGARVNIFSNHTKDVIGYFDRKAVGQKTYIIRKDGGDVLYFTESLEKKSIIYIYDPKGFVWGYFYQY